MSAKKYHQLWVGITLFVSALVIIAVFRNAYVLAAAGVLSGMIFMALARSKAGIMVDERERIIREKAARTLYTIFAPTIGVGALLLLLIARNELFYLEFIGVVLAYLTLFLIVLYAISYSFYNREYGGEDDEE